MTKRPFGNFNVIKQCDMQFLEKKNIKIVSFKHILIAEQALFSAFASKPGEQMHCEGEAFVSHSESVI